jgi:hypothetical protein
MLVGISAGAVFDLEEQEAFMPEALLQLRQIRIEYPPQRR